MMSFSDIFSLFQKKTPIGPEPKNISETQISKDSRFKVKKNSHSSDRTNKNDFENLALIIPIDP